MGLFSNLVKAPFQFTSIWTKSDEVIAEYARFNMARQLPPQSYERIRKDMIDRFDECIRRDGITWSLDEMVILKLYHLQIYSKSVGDELQNDSFRRMHGNYMMSNYLPSKEQHRMILQEMKHIFTLYGQAKN